MPEPAGTVEGAGGAGGPAGAEQGATARTPTSVQADVRITPGDILAIVVADEPRLTSEFVVRDDGKISLPMLGMVDAAGLTVTQLADRIAKLSQRFIVKPVVNVHFVSMAPGMVSILGQVVKPGTYDLRLNPTLVSLLTMAGGVLPLADMSGLTLVRKGTSQKIALAGGASSLPPDMALEPGDAVYVPFRRSAPMYVMGAVQRPGPQALSLAPFASRAVVLAGGPLPTADLRHTYLLRGRERIELNLEPLLGTDKSTQPKDSDIAAEDVVVVPAKEQIHVFVVGAVNTPGPQPAEEARLASQAIAMAGGPTDAADLPESYLLRDGEKTPLRLKALFKDGDKTADVALRAGDAVVIPRLDRTYHIVGQVMKPGPYTLDQANTLLDAWSLAGGGLEDANLNSVVLLRAGEQPRTIDVDAMLNRGDASQNVALSPVDTIVVPKAIDYVYVLGQVARPGPQPLRAGDTIGIALGRSGGPTALASADKIVLLSSADVAAAHLRAEQTAAAGTGAAGRKTGEHGTVAPARPKPVMLDMTKVGTGELAHKLSSGDIIYVPTSVEARSQNRQFLLSALSSLAIGLIVGRR